MAENVNGPERFLEFEADVAEGDPLVFSLGEEQYRCVPELSVGALSELSQETSASAQMMKFMEAILVDADEFDRFRVQATRGWVGSDGRRRMLKPAAARDLISRILREYTGRPSQPSVASPTGPSETGASSTDGAPSPEPAVSAS